MAIIYFANFLNFQLILIFLIILLVCVHYRYKQKVSYKLPNVPFVKWGFSRALDGFNTLNKFRIEGVELLERMSEKYGPIFRCPVAFSEFIFITDPEIIKAVLFSRDPEHLHKPKDIYDIIFTDLGKDELLASDVKVWTPHRNAVSPAFFYKALPTYFKCMNNGAREMMVSATQIASQSHGLLNASQAKEIIEHYAIKIISEIILGCQDGGISEGEIATFHADFRRWKELATVRLLHPELLLWPIWVLHPKKKALDRVMENMRRFSYKVTNAYRNETTSSAATFSKFSDETNISNCRNENQETKKEKSFECLVQQMIKARFTNQEIYDEVGTFLGAGHETIVTALDLLIFHLARNIEHQKNCRQEILRVYNEKQEVNNDTLEIEDLSKLKYLERCIMESLRLTPTVPIYLRRLKNKISIGKNLFVEANQTVAILAWAVHRDPNNFADPKKFDPDRFLPENVKQRHVGTFIPFSLGPRNCIGWKIALMEMKIVMVWLLRHFEITTTDHLDDVKLLFNLSVKPSRPFNIKYTLITVT